MRFTYAESMCDPMQLLPLARACDESGWSSFVVPDSIAYPEHSDSKYPYTPDGDRRFLDGKPFIEPFTLMAAIGAVTTRLRTTTFVVKLPIRHPVHVAKQLSSVAALTGGRVAFGVGSSPWPEDFAITGTPWKDRGRRMDEMIEIIRGLMTGQYFEFHGKHFDIPSIKMCPVPEKPVPILIGGHSEAALRRAARTGDGWMHGGGSDNLDALLAQLADLRREAGTDKKPFEIHVISFDAYTLDGAKKLRDQGITDAIVGFRNPYVGEDDVPLQEKIDTLRRFADDVIARL
ncbi:MAG TPA: TIGR03619 family F420-dependent LLM class oxidoreductase [Candidatus Limnocylindrales bacterium]|nr:TIGR03619 family F420-dependent LLM class oxidoreductase [Candidatus Limnocylindrales bacterium]